MRKNQSPVPSVEKSSLLLNWATIGASKYACENWHYSRILPTGKIVKIGVWEFGKFIGVVLFSRGASPHLGTKFKLKQTEICELTRVALSSHATRVSRIISIALKFLKTHCPGIKLVVSFADPEYGHSGGIYKAGNWIYSGASGETIEYLVRGRWRHVRGAYAFVKGRESSFKTRTRRGKHRFLMPLDLPTKELALTFSKPYPKRAESIANDVPFFQDGEGGVTPTSALQNEVKTV